MPSLEAGCCEWTAHLSMNRLMWLEGQNPYFAWMYLWRCTCNHHFQSYPQTLPWWFLQPIYILSLRIIDSSHSIDLSHPYFCLLIMAIFEVSNDVDWLFTRLPGRSLLAHLQLSLAIWLIGGIETSTVLRKYYTVDSSWRPPLFHLANRISSISMAS